MLATMQSATIRLDEATQSIIISRAIAAEPARVYEAWTRPEELRLWWDPRGVPLAACEIDLREGGSFRFLNEGHPMPFAGTWLTLNPPHLIEMEAVGARCRLELRSEGAGTLLLLTILCPSREVFEAFIERGIPGGTGRTIDNLAARFEP